MPTLSWVAASTTSLLESGRGGERKGGPIRARASPRENAAGECARAGAGSSNSVAEMRMVTRGCFGRRTDRVRRTRARAAACEETRGAVGTPGIEIDLFRACIAADTEAQFPMCALVP